jgi:hypothetical protein
LPGKPWQPDDWTRDESMEPANVEAEAALRAAISTPIKPLGFSNVPHSLRSVGPIKQLVRILAGAIDCQDELTVFVRATAGLLDLDVAMASP